MLEISTSSQHIGTTFSSLNPNVYEEFKRQKDAEIFEKVVFDLILNKYSTEEEKEFVQSLNPKDQRMALLLLIDGDNKTIWSEMISYVNECSDKFEHIQDVLTKMSKFVKNGVVEKKKFGEVMTPISLIRKMLKTLPKEVWSNPYLKWLDPANGAGTFPYVVIYMLMKGLAEWEPDVEKRYKHIVENMIYTCELQSRNVFLWLCGVDPKNEYTTNSYWGSFLDIDFDYHVKNVWCVEKFDIILGNPPYQDPENKRLPLWQTFLKKSFSLLNDGGYINYVHPSAWRKPRHELLELFKSNNLLYLNINSQKEGVSVFGAGTRFDYYLLQKGKYNGITKIVDEDEQEYELNIEGLPFIPHSSFDILESIISNDNGLTVIHSRSMYGNDKRHMSKTQSDVNQYPCVYSTPCRGNVNFLYSSIRSGHFGINKIIIGKASPENCIYDNGQYGVTNNCFAIEVADAEIAEKIITCIKSDKFKKFVNNCKWSGYSFEHEVFELLKKDFWVEF
jgi:hypothetical protein